MPAPTVWSDDNATGTITWNNPGNAEVQDDINASTSLFGGTGVTHYLKGLNPGFAEVLPPRQVVATVRRIGFTVGGSRVVDHTVKLVVGGAVTGTNKATVTPWAFGDYEEVVYTWDVGTDVSLTLAQVNAADFGIVIAAQNNGSGSSVSARIDVVTMEVLPAVRHLTNTDWLGRPKLGQKLSLTLQSRGADDVPIQPDAAPYADIYAGVTLVETVRLPVVERYKVDWLFGLDLFLGAKYAVGQHMIVYRYLLSTMKYQAFAYFEIVGGGSVSGPAIALCEYRKPESAFILTHYEDGSVQYGQNPEVG